MEEIFWQRDGFYLSSDKGHLDMEAILTYLIEESYWNKGNDPALIRKSIKNSAICIGVYEGDPKEAGCRQIGFARVVSDLARHAYIADVYILEEKRGCGLGKWLMEAVLAHPELQAVKRLTLSTADAHGLYAQFGFTPLAQPEKMMELVRPGTLR